MGLLTDKIKDKMIFKSYNTFLSLHYILKSFILVLFFIVIFIFLRIGFFGAELSTLTKRVVSIEIPYIDPKPKKLVLLFKIEAKSNGENKLVFNEDKFHSGTIFSIKYNLNLDSWVLLINRDSRGIWPIVNEEFKPIKYSPNPSRNITTVDFKLDNNSGDEYFYIFASKNHFTFEKNIKPYLNNTKNSKGVILLNSINIPSNIIYKAIHVKHL